MNRLLLEQLKPTEVTVAKHDEEAEADEMWSFVRCKKQERWLWSAIDYQTGQVLACVLADHKDQALVELKALLEPTASLLCIFLVKGGSTTKLCFFALAT